jgi:hypothetical protein
MKWNGFLKLIEACKQKLGEVLFSGLLFFGSLACGGFTAPHFFVIRVIVLLGYFEVAKEMNINDES